MSSYHTSMDYQARYKLRSSFLGFESPMLDPSDVKSKDDVHKLLLLKMENKQRKDQEAALKRKPPVASRQSSNQKKIIGTENTSLRLSRSQDSPMHFLNQQIKKAEADLLKPGKSHAVKKEKLEPINSEMLVNNQKRTPEIASSFPKLKMKSKPQKDELAISANAKPDIYQRLIRTKVTREADDDNNMYVNPSLPSYKTAEIQRNLHPQTSDTSKASLKKPIFTAKSSAKIENSQIDRNNNYQEVEQLDIEEIMDVVLDLESQCNNEIGAESNSPQKFDGNSSRVELEMGLRYKSKSAANQDERIDDNQELESKKPHVRKLKKLNRDLLQASVIENGENSEKTMDSKKKENGFESFESLTRNKDSNNDSEELKTSKKSTKKRKAKMEKENRETPSEKLVENAELAQVDVRQENKNNKMAKRNKMKKVEIKAEKLDEHVSDKVPESEQIKKQNKDIEKKPAPKVAKNLARNGNNPTATNETSRKHPMEQESLTSTIIDQKNMKKEPKKSVGNRANNDANAQSGSKKNSGNVASEQKDAAADEVVDSDSEEQSCKYNVIGSIRPVNVEAEKSKFFKLKFDYNPTFKYYNPLPPEVLQKYSNASDLYLPQAVKIMKFLIRKYGSYEKFESENGGRLLSRQEIINLVKDYCRRENFGDGEIILNLSEDLLSTASMTRLNGPHGLLCVRVGDMYESWIEGMLRHELSTHYVRSVNNLVQPWAKNKDRKKFKLYPVNPTEEGLASLHTVLLRQDPLLFRNALLYFAIAMAAKLSFKDLFIKLGCFAKDQVYLTGALNILKNRKNIDFQALMKLGKVSFEDVDKLKKEGSGDMKHESLRLPSFMQNMKFYKNRLDVIMKSNGLTDNDFKVSGKIKEVDQCRYDI
ncbi:uncharacterized protein LOC134846894 isoform X2 [Symsagittifera roscoffensis]|uniref:uncharacterized protein LOC134846894 isoform X2 n=1 Tax=Symsagittifera roscoffensis TaxID=84072 RepID=UPI00307CC7A3